MGKRDLEDDPRYDDDRLTPSDKEELFNEYITVLGEADRKKQREEAALKERERETQRFREKELRERERIQRKNREQESITNYQILLREKIRDSEASWTRSRKGLEEDPRWKECDLTVDMKEKFFREHVKMLQDAQVNDFRTLLAEKGKVGAINLTTKDFEQVKSKLRDDPRYERVSPTERRNIFERFLRDLQRGFIEEFKELLTENKNEGNISSKSETSGYKFEKLKGLLQVDKRYTQLDAIPEERERVMVSFIQKVLEGKGK